MNLWHDVGITYPALRAILKGGRDRFRQFIKVRDDYVYKLKFGNENDGYTYFNDLITNITYIKNITPIVVVSRNDDVLFDITILHFVVRSCGGYISSKTH